jgi:hypothetical protein
LILLGRVGKKRALLRVAGVRDGGREGALGHGALGPIL